MSLLLLQNANPEGFVEVLSDAFRGTSREIAAQTPRILTALAVFLVFLVLALIARRVLRLVLERVDMAPRIRILIGRLVLILTLVLGVIFFLVIAADASLGRIITGFGLLSVALGLALKSPLENMLSGIITILVAPFRIGDEIEISGYAGKVETISIHDTIIRTFDNKRVAVPNVDVYLSPILNQTAYPLRRYDVTVGIHYNDDLPKAVRIAHETLAETEGVRETPGPQVLVTTLNEFSVDMILRFWSEPSMQSEFKIVSDVTTSIKLAFDREGITIPFPIRTLHIPDGEEKGAGELQIRMTDEGLNGSKGSP
ncbi:MAG: mechanosensitive ion channel family protein [Rubrobacteraceae bacterium]